MTVTRRPPDPGATTAFDLPHELLDVVLRQLPPCSLASAAGVCRAWRDAAEDDTLWAVHLAARGRSLPPPKAATEKKPGGNVPVSGHALTRPPSAGGAAGGGGLGALRSRKLTRKPPRPLPPPPPPPIGGGYGGGGGEGHASNGGGEGKREFAKHVSLERRWRDAQFARCDLYRHTWSGGAG